MLDLQGAKEDGGADVGRRMIFSIFSCVLILVIVQTQTEYSFCRIGVKTVR